MIVELHLVAVIQGLFHTALDLHQDFITPVTGVGPSGVFPPILPMPPN
jgi:hypothetical protein